MRIRWLKKRKSTRVVAFGATFVLLSVIFAVCNAGGITGPKQFRASGGAVARDLIDQPVDQTVDQTCPQTVDPTTGSASGECPVIFNQIVDCDGTLIAVAGNGTFHYRLDFDGSGGAHFMGDVHTTLSGVGVGVDDAAKYSGSTVGKETLNVAFPNSEFTMVTKGNLQAEGTPTNYAFHQTFHITINPAGLVSSTVTHLECHGGGGSDPVLP